MRRIFCWNCGKVVSSPVPANVILRASVQCPECLEAISKSFQTWAQANTITTAEREWAEKGWNAAIEAMCSQERMGQS